MGGIGRQNGSLFGIALPSIYFALLNFSCFYSGILPYICGDHMYLRTMGYLEKAIPLLIAFYG
jgi:hypothetical protein